MTWCPHNLAETVGRRFIYTTLPCPFPRPKIDPLYFRLASETDDPAEKHRHLFDHCHTWDDHAGGLKGGRCERCGKLRREVVIRVNPKTGRLMPPRAPKPRPYLDPASHSALQAAIEGGR